MVPRYFTALAYFMIQDFNLSSFLPDSPLKAIRHPPAAPQHPEGGGEGGIWGSGGEYSGGAMSIGGASFTAFPSECSRDSVILGKLDVSFCCIVFNYYLSSIAIIDIAFRDQFRI